VGYDAASLDNSAKAHQITSLACLFTSGITVALADRESKIREQREC